VIQLSGHVIANQVEVTRSGPLGANASVQYRPIDGTAIRGQDYDLPAVATLVFPAGVARAYIPVQVVNDNIAEGTRQFTLQLFNPSPPAVLGRNASAVYTIVDDDFGGTVNFERATYTAARPSTVPITITRTGGLGTVLTVQWSAVGGTGVPGRDFTPASGRVTFGADDTSVTFTVQVLAADAPVADKTVIFGIDIAPGAAKAGPLKQATLTITGAH
jgi:hypothetical protein